MSSNPTSKNPLVMNAMYYLFIYLSIYNIYNMYVYIYIYIYTYKYMHIYVHNIYNIS